MADCGQPPSVAGGSIQGSDFSEGGKVTITCTGGGSIVSGDAERTCGKDGQWTGTTPVCKSMYYFIMVLEKIGFLQKI